MSSPLAPGDPRPSSGYDWRNAPYGVRLHAGNFAVALCGSPRDVNGRSDGDKCRNCLRVLEARDRWLARRARKAGK